MLTNQKKTEFQMQQQQVSSVLEYEVGETIHPFNDWIKHIKMKGEKVDKGEKAFSKEIKGKDEVNVVQKYTQKGKCEVSCNKCFCVKHTAQCTVQHAGVRGVSHRNKYKNIYLWL